MTERRYQEDEVREIFGLASSGEVPNTARSSATNGLTLAHIQSIGLEVGLDPDLVARAAAALDARTRKPMRKSFGLPIEVGRIVPLPRALTDYEWEQLVAELRNTFRARGQVSGSGNLREWSNGNLHACVEPTEAGYRLRLGTLKGDAIGINALAATGIIGGTVAFAALALSGGLTEAFLAPWLISAGGVASLLTNVIRLPRWARQRDAQMEHIAAKATAILHASSKDDVDRH